jgi:putative restriction endonuclease
MKREEILQAFDRIRVWQQGGQRAPHKPLLILLALGRLVRGEAPQVEFGDIEGKLKSLLSEFGTSRSVTSRHYPFWHLATDRGDDGLRIWELSGPAEILNRPPSATPNLTELRDGNVFGAFPDALRRALIADPTLINEIGRRLVDAHFPETLRRDVLDAVGLTLDETETSAMDTQTRRRRDPAFREKVLLAYEYRCCVCGYDLRMGGQSVGLEAAHIKWFQAGGPDVEINGLCLCALHHKIFDLGAFTVRPEDGVMVFSRHAMGSPEPQSRLLAYHGAALINPQNRDQAPHPQFLDWHRREVFKEPGRAI